MKQKIPLVACGLLFAASALFAQSRPVDQISGTWSGDMGPNDTNRTPLTVQLKSTRGSLTGTVTGPPHPGEIKSGTFDSKTGALKFMVHVQDGSQTLVTFDGKVLRGAASGTVSFDGQTGNFNLTKVSSTSAGAPKAPIAGAQAALSRSFAEVSGWVTRAAELVPADKYGYQPTKEVRTFGQLIGHIVDGYNYNCGRAAGKTVPWPDAGEKAGGDKAATVQKLKQALDACNAVYASSSQIDPLVDNIAHTSLHYGNVITYMRMLGLKPPSS
jgi:uncharacterized damage-inducible protein DinB